jgi:triosephosphate isomerase
LLFKTDDILAAMRKKIIAGNWKMYKDMAEANDFLCGLMEKMPQTPHEVLIAPSFTNLWHAFETTRNFSIEIVAQNMHEQESGAYTGEVSAAMLKSVGVTRTLLGHSERRTYFQETATQLAKKVATALQNDMQVIFCVGEQLEDRKSGKHFSIIESQLRESLFQLQASEWDAVVIAYEPVWAIGTGETASPEQAQEMHAFIRKTIAAAYDEATAQSVSILYGGSVKPGNAEELFSKPDVDGALVGGASLEVDDFLAIIKAMP